jgi:hypothetical protein
MEHQTAKDTTEGSYQPLGTCGAQMADTVGETKGWGMAGEPKLDRPDRSTRARSLWHLASGKPEDRHADQNHRCESNVHTFALLLAAMEFELHEDRDQEIQRNDECKLRKGHYQLLFTPQLLD